MGLPGAAGQRWFVFHISRPDDPDGECQFVTVKTTVDVSRVRSGFHSVGGMLDGKQGGRGNSECKVGREGRRKGGGGGWRTRRVVFMAVFFAYDLLRSGRGSVFA